MSWLRPLERIGETAQAEYGGKACALGTLLRLGLPVPAGVAVSTGAYRAFADATGLSEAVALELGRKRFVDMRWEELWDASLRIRNRFARAAWPEPLGGELSRELGAAFGARAAVVRSSAPGEDAADRSFAGLHDSYVNVRGVDALLAHVRRVWASLWSDRALLYRQELGLDPAVSAMAVVVQELRVGERSGVCFTRGPVDPDEAVLEAVWGLNEGLVDGTVAPDRWHLHRETGVLRHAPPEARERAMRPTTAGTRLETLPAEERERPPLAAPEVHAVVGLARRVEEHAGAPQDVEFTLAQDAPWLLQARPVTARAAQAGVDDRAWYLTLHRSFEQLQTLRQRIEQEVLPGMAAEADALAAVSLDGLGTDALAAEIRRRQQARERWVEAYWQDCIPFAHGIRLFGQVVNERLQPRDPFAFVELLRGGNLLAVRRNQQLDQLAEAWREAGDPDPGDLPATLRQAMDAFLAEFGPGLGGAQGVAVDHRALAALLSQWGAPAPGKAETQAPERLTEAQYFGDAVGEERAFLQELLELGRASYRLRDDDNLFLGRIDAELVRALRVGRRHLGDEAAPAAVEDAAAVLQRLEDPSAVERSAALAAPEPAPDVRVRARQLVGQPASPGFAVGRARVVHDAADLFRVQRGEVLVCDAVDPNMTFVAPLCAGIVERRGGMLIHGAIIAREYGVPAVTGVPEATRWIHTGDRLAVDGVLGLVTVTPTASRNRG